MFRVVVAAIVAVFLFAAPISADCTFVYSVDTDPQLVCDPPCPYIMVGPPLPREAIWADGSSVGWYVQIYQNCEGNYSHAVTPKSVSVNCYSLDPCSARAAIDAGWYPR